MSGRHFNAGRDALDFIDRLSTLTDPTTVVAALRDKLASYGFHAFLITGLPEIGDRIDPLVLLNGWPPGWFELYLEKSFSDWDPIAAHCKTTIDPFAWGEKAIAHYQALRIDPLTKRLVFSDGLDIARALELYHHFHGRIQTSFGIGTYLSNDTPHQALNIVMKITACNGQPVAKLSDAPGKTLCEDETFLAYLRQVFHHPA